MKPFYRREFDVCSKAFVIRTQSASEGGREAPLANRAVPTCAGMRDRAADA